MVHTHSSTNYYGGSYINPWYPHGHFHCHHLSRCWCGYCYGCGRYVGAYIPAPTPYYPPYATWQPNQTVVNKVFNRHLTS